jgi:hypothetical protein
VSILLSVSTACRLTFVVDRVLIAAIRDKGLCPCPRCLIPKVKVDKIGHLQDSSDRITKARSYSHNLITLARDFVYKLGYGVTSAAIDRLLKPTSLVPTYVGCVSVSGGVIRLKPTLQNTFGEKLGSFGFNPYVMLVVDLMHEFELGIWKVIFTHIVRLLHAAAPAARLVVEFDRRYGLRHIFFWQGLTVLKPQVPTGSNFLSRHHPPFQYERFRNEEVGSEEF